MERSVIKKYLLLIALIGVIPLQAHAALPPSSGVFAGPYLGVNAGYSWGKSYAYTTTTTSPNSYFFDSDVEQIAMTSPVTLSLNNPTGGVEGGYNYQIGRFLLGAEADFDALSGSASSRKDIVYLSAPPTVFTLYTKTSTNWFLELRPRIGFVVNRTLLYVTGGVAWVNLKTNNSFSDNFLAGTPLSSDAFGSASTTQTKAGSIFGAGVEYAVTDNIFVKGEYLHAKFGKVNSNGNLTFNPAYLALFVPPLATPAPLNHSANFTNNILRVGVNYKFA